MTLQIRELRRDDRDEVAAWIESSLRAIRVLRPGQESRGIDSIMELLAHPEPAFERLTLVALLDGRVVGSGERWLFTGSDADKALVDVSVDPAFQGRGVGRALADAVQARSPRPVLLARADFRDDWETSRTGRFAAACGFRASSMSTLRELPWPPDPRVLDGLARPTAGYRIDTWVDGLPEDLRGPYGVLAGLVEKDAPSGEVEWGSDPWSAESYAQELARELSAGMHRVESLASVEGPDGSRGEVVGFTSVSIPANPRRFMEVGSTYVHRDHRGHGLGLSLKIAIERCLLSMDLPHPSLRTDNDDENTWMVAINEQLGFVPVVRTAELVKRVGP